MKNVPTKTFSKSVYSVTLNNQKKNILHTRLSCAYRLEDAVAAIKKSLNAEFFTTDADYTVYMWERWDGNEIIKELFT